MNRCIRWTILASCILFLSGTVTVQPARADLISGQYTSIAAPDSGTDQLVPVLTSGTNQPNFTLTNGTIVSPLTLMGDTVNNLLVDVTPFDSVHGNNSVDLNNASPTPQFIVTNPADPSQMVVLDLVNPAVLFDNNSSQGTGSISAGLTLDPTSPGIPLFNQEAFAEADLTINFTGISIVSTLPNGMPDGAASWTGAITATFQIQSVPEPSALVLSMVGGMTLAGAGWLRRKTRGVGR
jgi:hypothetical protein